MIPVTGTAAYKRSASAAINRIIASAARQNKTSKAKFEAPTNAFQYGMMICAADRNCGFMLYDQLPDVPVAPFDKDSKTILVNAMENTVRTNTVSITENMPSLEEIREYERKYKQADKNGFHSRNGGAPMFLRDELVDTKYLKDILAVLPTPHVYVNPDSMLKPILFCSRDVDFAVLMPIMPIGAVYGEDDFYSHNKYVNHPIHPENVFKNKSAIRYAL